MQRVVCSAVILTAIIVSTSGCGGGGESAATPTGDVIRQIQPGDALTYSLTGTITVDGESIPVRGTWNLSTTSSPRTPLFGNRSLNLISDIDVSAEGEEFLFVETMLVEQDESGTLYNLGGPDATVESATAPPILFPSPISVGQSFSYSASTSDGTVSDVLLTVTSLEPAAGRMAYRVHFVTTANGMTGTQNDWLVPDLGYPVRAGVILQQNGVRLEATTTLVSDNF